MAALVGILLTSVAWAGGVSAAGECTTEGDCNDVASNTLLQHMKRTEKLTYDLSHLQGKAEVVKVTCEPACSGDAFVLTVHSPSFGELPRRSVVRNVGLIS